MPASALRSSWDQARGPASDVGRDRYSKRTNSLRIANSPATKTPSASFGRGVRDHSFCAPKASNGPAIVNKGTTKLDLVERIEIPQRSRAVLSLHRKHG